MEEIDYYRRLRKLESAIQDLITDRIKDNIESGELRAALFIFKGMANEIAEHIEMVDKIFADEIIQGI